MKLLKHSFGILVILAILAFWALGTIHLLSESKPGAIMNQPKVSHPVGLQHNPDII